MFTVAGMVPFKPYFIGDEAPPYQRAVSSQKCARAGGKHNDLDDVGRTSPPTFFEMLGNFSFGDYFKRESSVELGAGHGRAARLRRRRLWITVHESDDEAEASGDEEVGVPLDRIQRLGDKDNFWQMGDTGPCGPCSRDPHRPQAGVRPVRRALATRATGSWSSGTWSSCSSTSTRRLTPLPKPSIDTGTGSSGSCSCSRASTSM